MTCGNPSTPHPPRTDAGRGWRRALVGAYRLGVLALAALALRLSPATTDPPDPARLLAEARVVLPRAEAVGETRDGWTELRDTRGELVGWATTTFPEAATVPGYAGPSELLVVFDEARMVRGVRFWDSTDTDGHVAKIKAAPAFWEQWLGRSEARLADPGEPVLVSGASLTSEAMARGLAARFGARGMGEWFIKELRVEDVTSWFPSAATMETDAKPGVYTVRDRAGASLGAVLRGSRQGVAARGFNGPSDVLVALDATGETVLGVALLDTRDNEPYVTDVRDELRFVNGFAGRKAADLAASGDHADALVVSGASRTAAAVVTTVEEMLRRHRAPTAPRPFPWATTLALGWIALGAALGLTRSGSKGSGEGGADVPPARPFFARLVPLLPKLRLAYALLSVLAGLTWGVMVSQDQLTGWARHGAAWSAVLPLLTLTAVALLAPVFTGKNLYCSRLCPHGAAQTLARQARLPRRAMPPRLHRVLHHGPWVALLALWTLALFHSRWPLADAEPFETWSTGFQSLLPSALLIGGLVAAFFLPQAYCHYGCPTGALLKFLSHSPGRLTAKDALAGGLALVAFLIAAR